MNARTNENTDLESQLDDLDRDGYVVVRGALDEETVLAWRECLVAKHDRKEWDIHNKVGNVAFDRLLDQEPELAKPLIGHASVAPILKGMLGKQCQLRSFRAHVNPASYTQEWHRDFLYYWDSDELGRHAVRPLCINTTFYLTDNTPETGRLRFLKDYVHKKLPDHIRKFGGVNYDNPFHKWCETQESFDLHPMSGDAVVFFSHIPHQGAKLKEDPTAPIRSNVVLHYQQTPMYWGIPFVSSQLAVPDALGFEGSFPFSKD